jgi:hypothetical protein
MCCGIQRNGLEGGRYGWNSARQIVFMPNKMYEAKRSLHVHPKQVITGVTSMHHPTLVQARPRDNNSYNKLSHIRTSMTVKTRSSGSHRRRWWGLSYCIWYCQCRRPPPLIWRPRNQRSSRRRRTGLHPQVLVIDSHRLCRLTMSLSLREWSIHSHWKSCRYRLDGGQARTYRYAGKLRYCH